MGERNPEEPKRERTTIDLLKRPDLDVLRNLKASLTLEFNTEVSYRDTILYLVASEVLGTKHSNGLINGVWNTLKLIRKEGCSLSEALADIVTTLSRKREYRMDDVGYWEAQGDAYYDTMKNLVQDEPDKSQRERLIAEVEQDRKDFLEALKKVEKAPRPWEVK